MDGLSLDNPHAWERLRLSMGEEEVIALLRTVDSEIAQIRLAEMLLAIKTPAGLHEATALLAGHTHPLACALLIGALGRHKLWHRAYTIAKDWAFPVAGTPLLQEAAYIMSIHGSMAALGVRDKHLAARLLGRAEVLHELLGLTVRSILLQGEIQRINTLEGHGNPDAIRALLRENLNEAQFRHNTHNLAESLAARGQYADAIAELKDTDPRSVGMRAFYGAMLSRPFFDPGGNDDYLRLARTVASYQRGGLEVGDVECTHEPQATYARLLTTESLVNSPSASRRHVGIQIPIPQPHDQRVWWVLNRLGALAKGLPVPDAHLIYEVWQSGVEGLCELRDVLDARRLGRFGDRLLVLAALDNAPDQILRIRESLPILTGETIVCGEREHNACGRIGSVHIATAFNPDAPIEPLRGSEPTRWQKRVQDLIRTRNIPFEPVNPGHSLRAAIGIRDARLALNLDTSAADRVVAQLMNEVSLESQNLLYSYGVGGEYETTLADGAGSGFGPGPRLAGRTG